MEKVPIQDIPPEICRRIRYVLTDIDDTLSTHGKILPEAYQSLWDLSQAGLTVIPITGRCAGWVDHIARFWPVGGVVGENGAFYFMMKEGKLFKKYYLDPKDAQKVKGKLLAIRDEILAKYPQLDIASDQPYREFDLAIDFCEDVPRVPWSVVEDVVEIFRKHGAQAKVSSIHVNGWFGDFNKLKMTRAFLQAQFNIDLNKLADKQQVIFIGDSPNDQPMFEFFPESVAVSNISEFWNRLKFKPKYVCEQPGGLGFAEFAHILLAKRALD
jgi:HAD superfamily hydrolase (TIGR01484 family)